LGCCVDGDLEDFGGFYHLLGGGDDFLILPDCLSEFLLEIAYEERWPVQPSTNTFRHFEYCNCKLLPNPCFLEISLKNVV